eukprot:1152822-Pelagomonas_calceolata.AAC.5
MAGFWVRTCWTDSSAFSNSTDWICPLPMGTRVTRFGAQLKIQADLLLLDNLPTWLTKHVLSVVCKWVQTAQQPSYSAYKACTLEKGNKEGFKVAIGFDLQLFALGKEVRIGKDRVTKLYLPARAAKLKRKGACYQIKPNL